MKIQYQLERNDYYKISLIKFFLRREIKCIMVLPFLFISAYFISENVGTPLLIIGCMIFLTPLSQLYWTRRLISSGPQYLSPVEMTLEEDSIEIKSSAGSSQLTWDQIHSYKDHKSYIFLYLNELIALSIPKKQLSHEQIDQIQELVQRKKNNA